MRSPKRAAPTAKALVPVNLMVSPIPVRPSTTWWLWRGARTRSHPELGRENPQRRWYCVLRRGRVGRRQVFEGRTGHAAEIITLRGRMTPTVNLFTIARLIGHPLSLPRGGAVW